MQHDRIWKAPFVQIPFADERNAQEEYRIGETPVYMYARLKKSALFEFNDKDTINKERRMLHSRGINIYKWKLAAEQHDDGFPTIFSLTNPFSKTVLLINVSAFEEK